MMNVNWIGGIAGGLLIGIAATLLLLFNGRIAGVSGIVGQLFVSRTTGENLWRLLFVVGIIVGAAAYSFIAGGVVVQMQTSGLPLIVAGILVGAGTRLGSGCTSGHGVCGIARRSPRSITATLIFISIAVITVLVLGPLR